MSRETLPRLRLMVAGAEKAGTTSLKDYIDQHPDICMHPQMELMHFVVEAQYDGGWSRALDRYYPHYRPGQILAGKSVGIMHVPGAAERLAADHPGVKVVAVLRNPVDRAYSAYWHARRQGWERAETFERALAADASRADGGTRTRHLGYVERGRYEPQLRRLFDVFGPGATRVYLFEDLKRDAEAVCREVFEHAGVDAGIAVATGGRSNVASAPRSRLMARFLGSSNVLKTVARRALPDRWIDRSEGWLRAVNERRITIPSMDETTRSVLASEFAESNRRLGTLIGRDLSHWDG